MQKQPKKTDKSDPIVRVRGGPKGVRHIRLSDWKLEKAQAKGKSK